jgi:hypothetical protein
MKDKDNKLYLAIAIIVGIVIGYLLFSGVYSGGITGSNTNNSNTCGSGVTTTTPTVEGDNICTRVCIPKPIDCPRQCPTGTHWECGGTLAMTCGCVKDPTTPSVILPETGPRGCIDNPSICGTSYFCDTGMNQCTLAVN